MVDRRRLSAGLRTQSGRVSVTVNGIGSCAVAYGREKVGLLFTQPPHAGRLLDKSKRRPANPMTMTELAIHTKPIRDRENTGDAIGLNIGDGFVAFPADCAFQCHVAVFDDDVNCVITDRRIIDDAADAPESAVMQNGFGAIRGVLLERRRTIQPRIDGGADAIIVGREG